MADTVKRIESKAFCSCESLQFVRLSRNLRFIGEEAFYNCYSLMSIFIPPSCIEIGNEAFMRCKKLIILNVPQHTQLGVHVILQTKLIGFYIKSGIVNEWIKNRHNNFPLHKLCCSEDPIFNENTIIPTKHECCRQDDLGWTPLIYLILNHTAEYGSVEQLVTIGGKESLLIEDKKGKNVLHHAISLGDKALFRLLVKIGGRELLDMLVS
ncbi:hypothetical protein CTEN210_09119 [Chaetoceros tenuissimus]|uniref:Uncharacterized protein n=1 Tax=Chaetoceros tenuissimus TaxID=426638 RepID=A0AAD3CV06_9STRA|nr:hypothetical protein CTEN210_09119 [Chaetoceros tenuissimus]